MQDFVKFSPYNKKIDLFYKYNVVTLTKGSTFKNQRSNKYQSAKKS